MTPSSVDSTFASLSNITSSFPVQFHRNSSSHSPFLSVDPAKYWDSVLDQEFESFSPLASPFAPVDCATQPTLDVEMASLSDCILSPPCHQRRPRTDCRVALLGILQQLWKLKFTVIDLITIIIDGEDGFQGFCNALFSLRHCTSLIGLLEKLTLDKKGGPIVVNWMFPHVLCLVCDKIHNEMEAAKPHLQMSTGNITPEFIEEWDIQSTPS
jgi:hypothetical protein